MLAAATGIVLLTTACGGSSSAAGAAAGSPAAGRPPAHPPRGGRRPSRSKPPSRHACARTAWACRTSPRPAARPAAYPAAMPFTGLTRLQALSRIRPNSRRRCTPAGRWRRQSRFPGQAVLQRHEHQQQPPLPVEQMARERRVRRPGRSHQTDADHRAMAPASCPGRVSSHSGEDAQDERHLRAHHRNPALRTRHFQKSLGALS
jgi:hypothetical protein